MYDENPEFDEKDAEIRDHRANLFNDNSPKPKVGERIEFADGTMRRIAHVWNWQDRGLEVQTCDCGSFYLCEGGSSMSGALYRSIDFSTMELTERMEDASFWFFHHGIVGGGRGVYFKIPVRVWKTSLTASKS